VTAVPRGTEARGLTESLLYDGRVQWAEQQFDKVVQGGDHRPQVRVKRGPARAEEYGKAIPEELVELWAEEAALDRCRQASLPRAAPAGRCRGTRPSTTSCGITRWLPGAAMYCSGVTRCLQWYLHDTRTAVAGLPDISLHVEVGPGQGGV
jgi:hypothetical protein